MTIANPATGLMSIVNVDGESVPVESRTIPRLIGLRIPSITVNWWLSSDVDVVGTHTHEPMGCEIQTFWLDGLDFEEVETIRMAVISAIRRVSTPTRALVFDKQGITDANDWDSVLLYGGTQLPGVVESLLLGPEVSSKVLQASGSLTGEYIEGGLMRVLAT
ncbi:hypothetical protein [Streptomyces sp. NPDC090994]|uniref:hypothetical protein n=1 Tax=Streptomyces sp. NPDC090994 TaxID=3365969 RepID=UPI003808865B